MIHRIIYISVVYTLGYTHWLFHIWRITKKTHISSIGELWWFKSWEGNWWDITNQQHWLYSCVSDYLRKNKIVLAIMFFPCFFICCSVRFPCNLQHFGAGNCSFNKIATFWNSNWNPWQPRKPDLLVFLQFFTRKPVTGWHSMYTEKHNLGALCDSDIYMGLWLQNQQNIE